LLTKATPPSLGIDTQLGKADSVTTPAPSLRVESTSPSASLLFSNPVEKISPSNHSQPGPSHFNSIIPHNVYNHFGQQSNQLGHVSDVTFGTNGGGVDQQQIATLAQQQALLKLQMQQQQQATMAQQQAILKQQADEQAALKMQLQQQQQQMLAQQQALTEANQIHQQQLLQQQAANQQLQQQQRQQGGLGSFMSSMLEGGSQQQSERGNSAVPQLMSHFMDSVVNSFYNQGPGGSADLSATNTDDTEAAIAQLDAYSQRRMDNSLILEI
jgi:hypothetical protein